jgi:ABC-type transport system involved in multi-copper enzyme maturation permease subunit
MRPYLAIIKDSFRAALASQVLYVLLGIIVLVLAAISPLHIREALDTEIQIENIDDLSKIAERLVERKDDPDRPGAKRIWDSLPQDVQDNTIKNLEEDKETGEEKSGESKSAFRYFDLVEALNEVITDRSFYQEQDWDGKLDIEASDLTEIGVDKLTDDQASRLNRILIGRELSVGAGSQSALGLYYAVWQMDTIGQTHQEFATTVTSVLPYFFDKFVLSLGLLIAILVTANIIPDTFEPGSLNLLLSKPISRSGLFIAKFIGGCAFVALCASLLFVGLWIWMGFGLRIWDRASLISIPLYILVFAIYYSVSAFAGLVWKSVILSIVATAAFWAACFGVGTAYFFFNNRMENYETVEVVSTDQGLMSMDVYGRVFVMDDKDDSWRSIWESGMKAEEEMALFGFATYMVQVPDQDKTARLGPAFSDDGAACFVGRSIMTDPSTRRSQDLMMSDAGANFSKIGKFPRGALAMYQTDLGPLVVSDDGMFHRLDMSQIDMGSNKDVEDSDATEENDATKDKKVARKSLKSIPFNKIGPDAPVFLRSAAAIDFNRSNSEIAVYEKAVLTFFGLNDDGVYEFKESIEIETGARQSMSCKVAYQGDMVLLALGNGELITLDRKSMAEKNGYLPNSRVGVEKVCGSPDGRWFAVMYKSEELWILDAESDSKIRKASVAGQGTISAVNFNDQNQLIVGDRTDRVSVYSLPDFKVDDRKSPAGIWVDWAYRYGIKPIYFAFPKPSEFYKVVPHLSQSSDTEVNKDVDLDRNAIYQNPWSPVISGIGFMCAMLALSCFVFWWKDY